MRRALRILGVVATIGMFFVLVTGATVTNTGSEQGCGRSWPLCRGKLIPQMAVTTAIEWSHRADAATETLLILPLAIGAFVLYRRRRELKFLAASMVAFVFLQAGLGAWAVMNPQQPAILALHFGVSLMAFASVLLTTVMLFEIDGADLLRDRPIPGAFRWGVWLLAGYCYVVVYLGAYVRHANADFACTGWPLCNGAVVPSLHGAVGTNFMHRAAAGLLILAIAAVAAWAYRLRVQRPDLWRGALFVLGAVLLQALSGAVVVFSRLDIFSALAHAASAGLAFGSITYLCLHVLPRPVVTALPVAPAPSSQPVAGPVGAGR